MPENFHCFFSLYEANGSAFSPCYRKKQFLSIGRRSTGRLVCSRQHRAGEAEMSPLLPTGRGLFAMVEGHRSSIQAELYTVANTRFWLPLVQKKHSLSCLSSQHWLSRNEHEFHEMLQVNPLIVSEAEIN